MSRSRKLADLLDANGDVKSANLDNVPSSTNASALTSGTLPIARIADDAITVDKLANSINSEIAANTAKVGITTSQANAITANTAKVTNATHTGDVTGATALTIANDAVTVDKLNLISTGSVPSLEAKGTSGVTDGYIQLNCAENSHGIKLKSPPHSAGASYTLTFPNNDGNANEFLKTDGSGVMSWAVAGSTSASDLTSGTLPMARLSGTLPALNASALTNIPAANITGTLPAISGANLTNLPASGGSVTATADGAISAHQSVILQANGTVKAVTGSTISDAFPLGTPSTFDGNNSRDVIGFDLDPTTTGKGAIAWRDGSSLNAVVFTTSGSTITYGTSQTLCTVSNGFRGDHQCLTYVDGDKFLVGYIKNGDSQNSSTNGCARVCTVSGTSITVGSEVVVNAQYTNGFLLRGDPVVSNRFVAFYNDGDGGYKLKALAATVSGTSISLGSEHQITGSNGDVWHVDVYNGRVAITFKHHGDGYNAKLKVGTQSGDALSWGSYVTFEGTTHSYPGTCSINPNNTNEVLVAYPDRGNSSRGRIRIGTISTNTVSLGNEQDYELSSGHESAKIAFDKNYEDKFIVAYIDNNASNSDGKCKFKVGTISGSSISFGSVQDFSSRGFKATRGHIYFPQGAFDNKAFVAYNSDDPYGKIAILQMGGATTTNLTATNFLGFADAAYSDTNTATVLVNSAISTQSSLTPLTKYYVQTNGTLGTSAGSPSVLAGTAIASTKLLIKEEL